ncbi:hypothetical protein Tsubulata_014864 [Turnera subulata]|uniref:RNase H type-1 domain-containing protein n=1 Tax=Turnera subulata TaxID=218843 RepID=A0A9Q0JD18_9ROSI|nr:hypothetical protein Tsubulata_014864 [Turnera subulata]
MERKGRALIIVLTCLLVIASITMSANATAGPRLLKSADHQEVYYPQVQASRRALQLTEELHEQRQLAHRAGPGFEGIGVIIKNDVGVVIDTYMGTKFASSPLAGEAWSLLEGVKRAIYLRLRKIRDLVSTFECFAVIFVYRTANAAADLLARHARLHCNGLGEPLLPPNFEQIVAADNP